MNSPDVLIANEGTVFVFTPLTTAVKEWFEENVDFQPWNQFGNSFVVEHRFAWGLAQGLKDAGFALA